MTITKLIGAAGAAALLGACSVSVNNDAGGTPSAPGGGGSGPLDITCQSIFGGTTRVDFTALCATCSASNEAAAIDGNPLSHASMNLPLASAGTVSLRVTAQDGVVYPAGTPAGVIFGAQGLGNYVSQSYELLTYLDDVPTGDGGFVGPINGVSSGGLQTDKVSISTLMPFDAVELTYTQSSGTDNLEIQVFEFCTDD